MWSTSFTITLSAARTRTNGSPRVGGAQRTLEIGGPAPLAIRSATVERIPRRIGTSTGAKAIGRRRRRSEHGLLNLRDVLVAAEPVGAQVALDLDEAVVLGGLPARARDARQAGDTIPVRRASPAFTSGATASAMEVA